jgi:hypothetical protein
MDILRYIFTFEEAVYKNKKILTISVVNIVFAHFME